MEGNTMEENQKPQESFAVEAVIISAAAMVIIVILTSA
jgi:hypothetical protein